MQIDLTLTEPQDDFVFSEAQYPLFVGGFGCVHGDTLIATQHGFMKIKDITSPMLVVSWSDLNSRFELALSGGAFPKGKANLYRIVAQQGEFVASGHHHLLCADGTYQSVENLSVGQSLASASQELLLTNLASFPKSSHVNDEHYFQKHVDSMGRYASEARQYGRQLHLEVDSAPCSPLPLNDAQQYDLTFLQKDGQLVRQHEHTHQDQLYDQLCKRDLSHHALHHGKACQYCESSIHSERTYQNSQVLMPSPLMSYPADIQKESFASENLSLQADCVVSPLNHTSECTDKPQSDYTLPFLQSEKHLDRGLQYQLSSCVDHSLNCSYIKTNNIISITQLDEVERYYDMQVLDNNNYVSIDGAIHHNSGKTESLFKRLLIQKLTYPKLNQGYFAPSFDLISLIAFPRLSELLTECGLKFKLNKSEKVFHIQGYGKIICRSMDNPSSIVGFEIADAVIDELDTMDKKKAEEAWNKIIARCRQAKSDGKANTTAVGTTPEGFRFCYERWEKKKTEKYVLYRAPTASNPYLPESYIEGLRATYPPQLLNAYLDGLFVNLASGGVYPDFDRTLNGSQETIKRGDVLHVGMDFNVLKMACVIYVKRDNELHAVSELTGVRDTQTMADLLNERYKGHTILIYPDASGQATSSKNASESDHIILKRAGFKLVVNGSNPAVKDRINAVNAKIKNANGERTLFVNVAECPDFAEALEQQVYDKNGSPDKSTGHDHVNDAGGYCIVKLFPIQRPMIKSAGIKMSYSR